LIKTKEGRLGLANEDVKKGDQVCILFGLTVPVILRRGRRKTEEDIEQEAFIDQLEAMRRCMSRLEHRCFQRVRYERLKRRLEKEDEAQKGLPKDLSRKELYVKEMQEERRAINDQIASWKKEDEEAVKRSKREEEAKKRRKEEAEKRVKERNDTVIKRQATLGLKSPANLNGDGSSETEKTEEEQKEAIRKEDQQHWYSLHGEAYIHSMMDGEAIRERIMKGLPERLFEIR
jgi:septal ring factor EnvC (AmiA/AmiB activator)